MSAVPPSSYDPDMARPVPVTVEMDQCALSHLSRRFSILIEEIKKLQRLSVQDRFL